MSARLSAASRWISQSTRLVRNAGDLRYRTLSPSPTFSISSATTMSPSAATRRLPSVWSRTFASMRLASRRVTPKNGATNLYKTTINPSRVRQIPRRFNSTKTSNAQSEPTSLSQRLRKLTREYGWAGLGVYLLLSALDFPFCFAAVRLFGVERIGYYESVIFGAAKDAANAVWPGILSDDATSEKNSESNDGIWTQLAIAYAVHKSLIIFRVPLTAAITPNVVKTLRHWGWDLTRGRPKGM
ncbi:hypothetical protein ASPZODRAFT_745464 [Penicilliopsis zonata CBS 506.65]|uniref:DUF1279 domain-containing protein n=1 Tax=Penicilliopsis zonata CBS 506.65 TaxID=1073090 RepID=A0A1L9SCI7_9EURO|nr:hypothetical protein ASPZODRAFT_745464 [Penicilliopsis zonata CBS 506.65]OJJ44828.1 hypothetical protein ASPZODRAFT_745464 [Penicilliopsis zonata CBS 506.65]